MRPDNIPTTFVQYAADILADTNTGMSGPEIVKTINAYAIQYGVDVPHPLYPFDAPNKRTALMDNILAFDPSQQYKILKDLCDHHSFLPHKDNGRKKLKWQLVQKYGHLGQNERIEQINDKIIEETQHWLQEFKKPLEIFNAAYEKYESGGLNRNVLDDLRLALEKLLNEVLNNNKSLENQIDRLGKYIKQKGGSKELANMFHKLLNYYSDYQNKYVKHDDLVNEQEIELIFELTSSFMKYIVKLHLKHEN